MSNVQNIESDMDIDIEHDTVLHSNGFLHIILRILFSTPGLVLLVVIYSIVGALIFPLLEAPTDIQNTLAVIKSRDECLKELWTITGNWGECVSDIFLCAFFWCYITLPHGHLLATKLFKRNCERIFASNIFKLL